ncbi:hypothetical protein GCM10023405_08720 [Streptomonospora salina]
MGVERFVLDDGWFRGRRSDRSGLGDWSVDPDTWPQGLDPIVEHVQALGMDFGLWVEPEMANLDSDLVRSGPDRLLHPAGGSGRSWRHQYVLNIARPDTWQHVRDRLDALLQRYPVRYVKWDHNRDLYEGVHPVGAEPRERAARRRVPGGSPACTARPAPSTPCWTRCASATPAWSSNRARARIWPR